MPHLSVWCTTAFPISAISTPDNWFYFCNSFFVRSIVHLIGCQAWDCRHSKKKIKQKQTSRFSNYYHRQTVVYFYFLLILTEGCCRKKKESASSVNNKSLTVGKQLTWVPDDKFDLGFFVLTWIWWFTASIVRTVFTGLLAWIEPLPFSLEKHILVCVGSYFFWLVFTMVNVDAVFRQAP